MAGKKTHEQQLRTFERKPDIPDHRQESGALNSREREDKAHTPKNEARESEFPVSRGGVNQESDHHKHNRLGQGGHKPQRHSPAEEKH